MRLTEADQLPVQQARSYEALGRNTSAAQREHVTHLNRTRLADTEDEHHLIRGYD